MGEDLEKLKQRLPLLDYLRQQHWTARPSVTAPSSSDSVPLHPETRPSFYVNARKNLFYCHGCGQGGDLIRFVQLSRHLSFRQSLAYLEQQSALQRTLPPCWSKPPLSINSNSIATPKHSVISNNEDCTIPLLIKNCTWVMPPAETCGVISPRKAIPSICCGASAWSTRKATTPSTGAWSFPAAKAGVSSTSMAAVWPPPSPIASSPAPRAACSPGKRFASSPAVILVEGMFDLAVLWQAGFRHATCALGTHLTPDQFHQLCDRPRTVYLTFDVDANGSGQQAAQQLSPSSPGARHHHSPRPPARGPRSQLLLRPGR